jgi:hypothetical protein
MHASSIRSLDECHVSSFNGIHRISTVEISHANDQVMTGRARHWPNTATQRPLKRPNATTTPDRTRRSSTTTASQVDYRELPEHLKPDLTCQLTVDLTRSSVRSSPLLCFAKRLALAYVTMWLDAGSAHPVTMTVQHPIIVLSSPSMPPSFTIDQTHPLWVWSMFSMKKQLLYFTNFSTLAQMCQLPSVPPCVRVLAYIHKHFQGC